MSLALIPGSFDPMTLGHLSLVKEALKRYDEAVVAVMNNDKKTYLFDLPTRRRLAELTVAGLPRVRVVASEGLLVDLFDELHADIIVKGVRNETDRRYEEEMAAYNLSCNSRAKTLLLSAAKDVEEISSTRVRAELLAGKYPEALLAPAVIAYCKERGKKAYE